MKYDEIVERYILLRDKKAEMKRFFDEKVATVDTELERIEGELLRVFNETGIENVKTKYGTAFRDTRTSATVADRDTFFHKFVIPNEAWEFLESRVSKSAVEQYIKAHEDLPPGVNWSSAYTIKIHRPRGTRK